MGSNGKDIAARVGRALQFILAAVFILSALGKALSPSSFLAFRSSVPLLSIIDENITLWGSISLEVGIALLLVFRRSARIGRLCALVSLFVFSAMLMYASNLGVSEACGCFGNILQETSLDSSILRNFGLLVLAVLSHVGDNKAQFEE